MMIPINADDNVKNKKISYSENKLKILVLDHSLKIKKQKKKQTNKQIFH